MKISFYLVLLVTISWQVQAQQTVLDQYVSEGLANNLTLIKERIALEQQESKVKEAYGKFMPNVNFQADYLLAAGGRDIAFPIGDLLNPVYSSLNQVTGESRFPTNLENVNEQFLPNNFHDTRFIISQPLFNTAIYYNHKAQEQLVAVQDAKIAAYQVELKKDIKTAYFNYLKTARVLAIYDSTEILLQEVRRINQKLVKYDKATEDVIYSVDYEIQQLASDRARTTQQRILAQNYFNSLLHRDLQTDIEVEDVLNSQSRSIYDPQTMVAQALQTRPEIQQIERGIVAGQIGETLQEKMYLPTVGLQAQAGFQGFGYNFDFDDQAYATLGVGLQWNIFDGKQRKYRLQQAQLETQQLRQDLEFVKQQIELQVRDAWYSVQTAQQQLEAERAALLSVQKSFRLIQKRYAAEQAILVEYLDARTKMTNAEIAVSISQYDLLIRQTQLERALSL
jgi:outer membrane protein TolC